MVEVVAGRMNRRISLMRSTKTQGPLAATLSWVLLARVWAEIIPVSDMEKIRASEVYSNLSARFVIHWSQAVANLDTKDQLIFDGRTYDINGVRELGLRDGLEITASARGERA